MIPKSEPLLNVGILTNKKIDIELYGDFRVAGNKTEFSGAYTFESQKNHLICKNKNESFEFGNEVIFEPGDPVSESFVIKDVIIGSDFHWERKEKQRFIYSLKIILDKENLIAINIIPLESYLVSVISSEMSAKSSLELLKAHAVVSRSWVLAQIEKSLKTKNKKNEIVTSAKQDDEIIRWYDKEDHIHFDVCADDHCQRYQGVTKINSESARKAIKQTKGILLINENKICDTRYSKCCGGITEAFENVWEPIKNKYLVSVSDYKFEPENYIIDFSNEQNARKWIMNKPLAYCNTNNQKILSNILVDFDKETKDFFRWKVVYTQYEISEIISKKSGEDFGEILDLIPLQRGLSARLIKLKISGSNKSLIIGKELEIRRILSPTHLYSSAIIIEKSDIQNNVPQKFTIHGAGWGHGVGMCQIGAAVMAEQGFMFDEILLHYFKNTNLKKVY
jgi:SpoIID/LytB domain protein